MQIFVIRRKKTGRWSQAGRQTPSRTNLPNDVTGQVAIKSARQDLGREKGKRREIEREHEGTEKQNDKRWTLEEAEA